MSEKYVSITYIGRSEEKRDNILHIASRVWKRGGSRRVPLAEHEKYLAHPDEFQITTPLLLTSSVAEALSTDEQVSALLHLIGNLELHAAEDALAAAQARIAELNGHAETLSTEPEDRQRFIERRDKIKAAIAEMDDTDPVQYTDTGRPRVSVVAAKSGIEDVTAAEIAEAAK